MERRDLTLTTRVEDVREPRSSTVIHFELTEIKAHFDQSLTAIRDQFAIAEGLKDSGKLVGSGHDDDIPERRSRPFLTKTYHFSE